MKNTNKKQNHIRMGKTQDFFNWMIVDKGKMEKQAKMPSIASKFWILALCAALIFCYGCKTQPPTVIQKEEVIWTYKDSIVQRDSICYIPIERYVDIVPIYDTLVLENSIAISHSWVDTTNHLLRGELKNKNAIQYQVKYIERVVTNDSIVKVDRPIPYPVVEEKKVIPKWAWITLVWSVITLISIGYGLYRKFRP